MQDELTLLAMILLIISNGFLIFGCREIQRQMPQQSTTIQKCMGGVTELLDEALDMMSEFGNPAASVNPIVQGASESIQQILLKSLISKMSMPQDYGSTQEPQERTISEDEPTQTNQTEV